MSGALLLQNPDGANFQARAVLEMVRYHLGDGIEDSYNEEFHKYDAEPRVTRFDNCREQGYVIFMRDRLYREQINIAFYEHRNSDGIFVQVNRKVTFNAPTLNDITETMQDKYQSAFEASVGEIDKVADFIVETLKTFWQETKHKQPESLATIRAANIGASRQRDIDTLKSMLEAAERLRSSGISTGDEVDRLIENGKATIANAEAQLAAQLSLGDDDVAALFSVSEPSNA